MGRSFKATMIMKAGNNFDRLHPKKLPPWPGRAHELLVSCLVSRPRYSVNKKAHVHSNSTTLWSGELVVD